jgi:anti-anti-sigma factor
MTRISDVFELRETGRLTVVGINPEGITDFTRFEQCRDELIPILQNADCRVVRFDLDGIPFLASGILGLLISLQKIGVDIQLKNVSEHVLDVLHVTRLNEMVEILPGTLRQ